MLVLLLLPSAGLWSAAVAVFGLGLLKECWDTVMGSGFCWYDIAANAVGILFAAVILILGHA